MAFTVKARVLLELGAELISSDQIALYELIKNAIDADSEEIAIRYKVVLTASGYQEMDSKLAQKNNSIITEDFFDDELAKWIPSSIPSEKLNAVRDSLIGLMATKGRRVLHEYYCDTSYIEIEDWGSGMSFNEVKSRFLTIGTPHRVLEHQSGGKTSLGAKGVGRLSCMRLGNRLSMLTARESDQRWSELNIDWNRLAEEIDMDLSDFDIQPEVGEKKKDAIGQGTLLTISDLKADWSQRIVEDLIRNELSILQDPFDADLERLDLEITYNGQSLKTTSSIEKHWLKEWHGYFDINLSYVEVNGKKEPQLKGTVKYRPPETSPTPIELDTSNFLVDAEGLSSAAASLNQPLSSGDQSVSSTRSAGLDTLGPFVARGYWFNRQRKRLELPTDKKPEFKKWMDHWGKGLLVYRDGYRVYPYAQGGDDWLRLDPKALGGKAYKLNRSQFFGYVRISAEYNPTLMDQTNRQGIIDSPEKERLINILQSVIWTHLGTLVTKHENKETAKALSSIKLIDKTIREHSRLAKKQVIELARRVPSEAERITELRHYIDEVEAAWGKAKKTIKQQEKSTEQYVHLASVGLLTEFIIHELNRTARTTLDNLNQMGKQEMTPALTSMFQQLTTLEKRLRILDPVSAPGRQRKTNADIVFAIQTLIDAHQVQFSRHKIGVEIVGETFNSFVVEGHVYHIFENLISNSVYWLNNRRDYLAKRKNLNEPFKGAIQIEVDENQRTILFTDNGPGIASQDSEMIYEPYFSQKPNKGGRGFGLHIVKRLCEDNEIGIDLIEANSKGKHPGFIFHFPKPK